VSWSAAQLATKQGVCSDEFCLRILGRVWNTQLACTPMELGAQLRTGVMGGKQFGSSDDERSSANKQIRCQKLLLPMRR